MSRPSNPAMERCVATVASVAERLGNGSAVVVRTIRDHASGLAALNAVESSLLAAQSAADPLPEATAGGSWRLSLAEMLAAVCQARSGLLEHELVRQRAQLDRVRVALARLRTSRTIDDLVESIPVQACALGYERAMYSWIDREHWVPRAVHTGSGRDEARRIMAAGVPPYVHVRDLVEVEVVRDRRAMLVLDCETNPRMHPSIWPVMRATAYAVVPVVARNHVAGMLHVDGSLESGSVDEFDLQLLSMFGEGLGSVLDLLLGAPAPVVGGLRRRATPDDESGSADWVDALTAREHEVLRLVAIGLTNAQIGTRLFISQDTVKTHVKRLMKKLGAHTRAEAGALYHQVRAVGDLAPATALSGT